MSEALRAEQLTVRWGERIAVDGVSFHVDYGQLLAIAGPNAAGKTTLLKALLGLVPSGGQVNVAGRELSQLSAAERARTLAYIPQRSAGMPGVSVLDVVAQARYAHRAGFAAAAADDSAVASALEHTELTALASRAFDTLSGGEQRRVLIARALATGARVLLFDEPTAGLDIAQVLRFFRLSERLRAEGHALISVLHDLGAVRRHADAALLLAAGRSLQFGSTASVLASEHIARVYGVHVHENVALDFSLEGRWP
jgi:iron complex transport system ATP-binding protein